MAVAKRVAQQIEGASLIRKMFDHGVAMKNEHGAENVFDFSIGNPNVPPPPEFTTALKRILDADIPNKHGYMTNAGLPEVRQKIAAHVSKIQGIAVTAGDVVMTAGAGAALNLAFCTLCDPGEEVVVCAPTFVAYKNYVSSQGARLTVVPGRKDFDLNLDALEAAISPNTAAVIVNSPCNPSGMIYPETTLRALADLLDRKSRELGRRIYIVGDEPYRPVVYGNAVVPSLLAIYPHTVLCYSYSKDLSIPGERIGYALVHPDADDSENIVLGLTLGTLNLGFTNAPVSMQRVVGELQGVRVDVEVYRRRMEALAGGLEEIGFDLRRPEGAFYLFPAAPGGDDFAFCDLLGEELILAVPGTGFGMPGYFRLSYCGVGVEAIERSLPGFRRAFEKAGGNRK